MRSSRRPLLALSLLGALVSSASGTARAHAPAEVWHVVSTQRDDIVLATNRGLILGNLDTRDFTLLCNEAFDVGVSVPYRAAKLPSGRLVVATIDGLRSSDDRGCTWRDSPVLSEPSTPYLVQHPTSRERLYVASFGKGQGGVHQTNDGGETATKLLAVADDEYIGSLSLAAGAVDTIYASIQKFPDAGAFQYFVVRSSDGGKTWERYEVVLTEDERDLQLLAVNPLAPLQLVVRAVNAEPSDGERVLFSRDGGKTFSAPLTARAVTSATFSKDGKTVLVGGVDGLQRADIGEGALSFTAAGSSARISALLQEDQQRFAAGYYQGIELAFDGVGTAGPDDTSFTRWLNFNEVQTAASCPAPSTVKRDCASLFRDWQIENPAPGSTDAGVSDAGASDAGVAPPPDVAGADAGAGSGDASTPPLDASSGPSGARDSGCALTSGDSKLSPSWSVVLLGLALLRRRHARRERART